MFSLGEKQRIINSDSHIEVRDATNALVTTSGAVVLTDTLKIEGYASIPVSDITNIKMRRGFPAVNQVEDFAVTAASLPAGIAIGEAIEVTVKLKTNRYASELRNDIIGDGGSIIFTTPVLTSVTAAAVRTAIVTGWANYLNTFPLAVEIINVVASGTNIRISTLPSYEEVTISGMYLKRIAAGLPSQMNVPMVGTTVTAGTEGLGTGKFLEESVRMATPANTDPYGSDNAGTQVDIRGLYTEVSITVSAPYVDTISTSGSSITPIEAEAVYTFWMNEATTRATAGAMDLVAGVAVAAVANIPTQSVTAISAPLTLAWEEAEAMIIANGDSVPTPALFIA